MREEKPNQVSAESLALRKLLRESLLLIIPTKITPQVIYAVYVSSFRERLEQNKNAKKVSPGSCRRKFTFLFLVIAL